MRRMRFSSFCVLLSYGYYLECPHAGHGLVDAGDCAASTIQAFCADHATAPDESCIAGIRVELFIGDASVFAGRE